MNEAKVASFYDDPVKRACDAFSAEKAFRLKAVSLDTTVVAGLRRRAKFVLQAARGTLRAARAVQQLSAAQQPLEASV